MTHDATPPKAHREDTTRDGIPERFEVFEKLGHGGMATVYRARDTATESIVALKVLHPHLREDSLIVERFRREIAAARRIQHPAAIAIHDLIETPETLLLVLEYSAGVDLKRLIRRHNAIPVDAVLTIADQIFDVLHKAHDAGVIHRDIKPHNILIEGDLSRPQDLRVKIMDFGLARVDDLMQVTTHTMALGTPEYMAPECLESNRPDGRADLYGVGVTLFEALTGELPWRADSALAWVRLHEGRTQTPSLRDKHPHIPEHIDYAVQELLCADPEDRPSTARDAQRRLRSTVTTSPVSAGSEHTCRNCKAPLLQDMTVCLECGHESVTIHRTRTQNWRLYVPSKTLGTDEDYLTFQQKHALMEMLQSLGGSLRTNVPAEIDKLLRTPPVVVADHLSEQDRDLLLARCKEHDIDLSKIRPGFLGKLRLAPLTLRLQTIFVGFFISGIASIFLLTAVPDDLKGFATVVSILAMTITVLAIIIFQYQYYSRPLAAFGQHTGSSLTNDPILQRAVSVIPKLRSARTRRLLRKLMQRGITLRSVIHARRDSMPDTTIVKLNTALESALSTAERLTELEHTLEGQSPARIHDALQALEEKIQTSDDIHDVEQWIQEKTNLHTQLAFFDEAQATTARLISRLLDTSSRLHALHLELFPMNHVDDPTLASMHVALDELEIAVETERALATT